MSEYWYRMSEYWYRMSEYWYRYALQLICFKMNLFIVISWVLFQRFNFRDQVNMLQIPH